jgi:hypothetical protein
MLSLKNVMLISNFNYVLIQAIFKIFFSFEILDTGQFQKNRRSS